MTISPTPTVLTEQAWALQNKINPFPVGGDLQFDGERISFTLGALAGEAFLGWVEERAHVPDLQTRLRGGEQVVLFSWKVGEFEASWPATYAGAALEVTGPGASRWLIALDYPSGGSISQTVSLFTGRKKGKVWKRALAA